MRRDGTQLSSSPITSSKPGAYVSSTPGEDSPTCALETGSEEQVWPSKGGLRMRVVTQTGEDTLLLSGINQPRSITVDHSTG